MANSARVKGNYIFLEGLNSSIKTIRKQRKQSLPPENIPHTSVGFGCIFMNGDWFLIPDYVYGLYLCQKGIIYGFISPPFSGQKRSVTMILYQSVQKMTDSWVSFCTLVLWNNHSGWKRPLSSITCQSTPYSNSKGTQWSGGWLLHLLDWYIET